MEVTILFPQQSICCSPTAKRSLEVQIEEDYAEEIQLIKSAGLKPRAQAINYILTHLDPKWREQEDDE